MEKVFGNKILGVWCRWPIGDDVVMLFVLLSCCYYWLLVLWLVVVMLWLIMVDFCRCCEYDRPAALYIVVIVLLCYCVHVVVDVVVMLCDVV